MKNNLEITEIRGESRMMHPGHSGEYGNGAKLVGKMLKSVMQLI